MSSRERTPRTYMGPISMVNEAAKAKGSVMKIRVEIDGLPEKHERTIRFVMPTEIMVICTPGTESERFEAAGAEADAVLAAMRVPGPGLATPHLPHDYQDPPLPMPGHPTPHLPLEHQGGPPPDAWSAC